MVLSEIGKISRAVQKRARQRWAVGGVGCRLSEKIKMRLRWTREECVVGAPIIFLFEMMMMMVWPSFDVSFASCVFVKSVWADANHDEMIHYFRLR